MKQKNKCRDGIHIRPEKGITLIALIITIIVMLILVAVTITVSLNGGLFGYAKKAKGDTENAIAKEQELGTGSIVEQYLYGISEEVSKLPEYSNSLLDETTGVLKENTKYVSGNRVAVIPKGFKVSSVASEQNIDAGLVIQDETGNEFVWVPVEDGTLDRTGWWNNEPTDKPIDEIAAELSEEQLKKYIALSYGYETIEEAIEALNYGSYEEMLDNEWGGTTLADTINWFKDDRYWWAGAIDTERYTETLPTELETSINTYKGFYMGRYEAGSEAPRTIAGKDTLTDVVCKANLYPYNYVSYTNANAQIEKMYTDTNKYGVVATLPYGAEWDETMEFINDKVNVTNSTAWGNYANATFTFSGKYTNDPGATTPTWQEGTNINKEKASEANNWKYYLIGTGTAERNKAKNIYDLAGNVWEWTNEAFDSTNRVLRGGYCSSNGGYDPAVNRINNVVTIAFNYLGFRPALYVALDA